MMSCSPIVVKPAVSILGTCINLKLDLAVMVKLAPVNFTGAIFIPKFDRPDVVKLRGTSDATT